MDDFVCGIKVRSVVDWIQDETISDNCPPCLIAPLSSYYLGALEEAGERQLAAELLEVFEAGDLLTISKKLDNIKTNVGEALSMKLRDLDCFAQTFKPD